MAVDKDLNRRMIYSVITVAASGGQERVWWQKREVALLFCFREVQVGVLTAMNGV